MDKRSIGLVGLGLGLILFLAVNVLANATLRTWRLDLTREKLFTLSEGSRRIASELDEPIRLYLYVSQEQSRQIPQIKDYSERVRDVLEEYAVHSDGNLILEVIDPEPFSEAEERAVREGLTGVPLGTGDLLYFGLVATNATDEREVIPYFDSFDQDKERFLEYDLSRLIYALAHPEKNKVAVLSSLPLSGGPPANPMLQQQASPRWKILDQLASFYELEMLDTTVEAIGADVAVLVLIHPRDLSDATLYAIDQYAMRGGKIVAFVDPHCEADQSAADPTNPMSQFGASRASDLNRLFQAWGFEMILNKVAGDREKALSVQIPEGQRYVTLPFVVWLGLGEEMLDREDAITSLLVSMMAASPGALRPTADAQTTFTPLVWTSEDSMEIDVGRLQFRPDPQGLLASFVPGYQSLTLAARVTGPASSAFPDGRPEPAMGADPTSEEKVLADALHMASANEPIHVIAFADADLLADRWWIQEERLGPISLGSRKVSDNGDFLLNAIENLSGGEDLISIRARGRFSRPFDRVEEIRREAEQRYMSEQVELERRVQETEQEITRLQQEKSPDSALILSPEQQAQIDQLQEDLLSTRRQLRDVRHELRKDIERLGTRLKWLNVLVVPAVVIVAAIALGVLRVRRRGT